MNRPPRRDSPFVGVASVVAGASLGALATQSYVGAAVGCGVGMLLIAVIVDIRERRIPNAVTYPTVILALLLGAAQGPAELATSVAGLLVAGGILTSLSLISRGGLGMGDVKAGAAVGALAGPSAALQFVVAASVAGAVLAVLWLLAGHRREDALPYAPALAIGGLIVVLTAQAA